MRDSDLTDVLHWTPGASIELKKIPFFARSQARQKIEQLARQLGEETVTLELVQKAREEFGQ
ncbi:MAG: PCP reductase family protein [Cyanosarcina radialis HA8281-LM2]|nr:PCP reductase family protein [Cyanosarcina radialis HA8281-LM2]